MEPTDRAAEHTPPPETQGEIIARLTAEKAEQAQVIADLNAKLATAEARAAKAEVEGGIDVLTGLPNRRVMLMELDLQLALVRREDRRVAVAIFDLDDFKKVNDTYGHQQGDAVLKGFADRARVHKRGSDILGRYGGEEFLAIFTVPNDMSDDDVEANILERYHVMLKDLNRTGNDSEFIPQTVSIGCVVVGPGLVSPDESIIAAADAELYKAKAAGKNRSTVAVFKDAVVASI